MGGRVNYTEYVQTYMDVYNAGGTHAHIAKQLGITEENALKRSQYLRRKGVNLPTLRPINSIAESDVNKLNNIVNKSLKNTKNPSS